MLGKTVKLKTFFFNLEFLNFQINNNVILKIIVCKPFELRNFPKINQYITQSLTLARVHVIMAMTLKIGIFLNVTPGIMV